MSPEQVQKQLERIVSEARRSGDEERALACEQALDYARRWIARKVEKPGRWDEARCPACGASLSVYEGDGWYSHRSWLEYCPEERCHQKLDWSGWR